MGSGSGLAETDRRVCGAAEKFSSLFYSAMEKRRSDVHAMYTDAACFVWNGHALTGKAGISDFLISLPNATFNVRAIDAQAVSEALTEGKASILVTTAGTCRMQDKTRGFTETFLLTEDEKKWRIVSDRFRFVD